MELEISDDVLALLMKDIQRLPSDLQYRLQVAACIGSCVTESMLNCLSTELELDLKGIGIHDQYRSICVSSGLKVEDTIN